MNEKDRIINELMRTLKAVQGSLKVIEHASSDEGAVNLANEALHWIEQTLAKIES